MKSTTKTSSVVTPLRCDSNTHTPPPHGSLPWSLRAGEELLGLSDLESVEPGSREKQPESVSFYLLVVDPDPDGAGQPPVGKPHLVWFLITYQELEFHSRLPCATGILALSPRN
jgi:hypothetical protein